MRQGTARISDLRKATEVRVVALRGRASRRRASGWIHRDEQVGLDLLDADIANVDVEVADLVALGPPSAFAARR